MEKNGKGKEYYVFSDKLRFEREYLNDKEWIGTGYYWNCNVNYKWNNNINGKGEEYDGQGYLIFKGKCLNGLKLNGKGFDNFECIVYELNNGKGLIKEYDLNQKLIFEGEYLNGERV